ncbi:sorting nexin-2-like isoform X1 [Saccostrea echinata]|uniref:sorting nexin-2-like isoform X1 n=1 Tax=Saccostrea echinata TaxID=191078 RepID=UPI002A8357CD|nr:sorting nexin-2-like isoform X1 [Saccostrea echinata]
MADEREPPPFGEDENQKDEDDLFAEASEEQEKESSPEPEPQKVPIKPDVDLFGEDEGDEIKLNESDEEPSQEEKNDIFEDSKPVVTPEPISAPPIKEETPKLPVTQSSSAVEPKVTTTRKNTDPPEPENQYTLTIKVAEPHKVGDGMGAYMVYKVITKTSNPAFRKADLCVTRRFSDFLGLYSKLHEKHTKTGIIVPPAPEKSVLGMTKVKISKEESNTADFIQRRRAALERYLNRTASHPVLQIDPDFREFLEREGDLPKATNTSALSGAGVMRLFHKVGDVVEKIAFRMDESDEWFEEKQNQVESLENHLRKLHSSMESLTQHRRELSNMTAQFAKSTAMLGTAEEHTALSRALSQLAETEERIETVHADQSDHDFFIMAELCKDYVALLGAVKEVFHERVKCYKSWKEAEATLTKKRENKAKLEIARKMDKVPQAQDEISEWEMKVDKGKDEFEKISKAIRKEVARFDKFRVEDFKDSVVSYLEQLMENQQRIMKCWEAFLPEAKAIA